LKTDNSHFQEKVLLRIEGIKQIKDPVILECYSGTGKIWDEVQKITGKKIKILKIEKEYKKGNKIYLPGDNLKYLKSINLHMFDCIDLDAYGIPFKQLEIIFNKQYKGIVFVTAIQSMLGNMPYGLLKANGFTEQMIKKCQTIFTKKGVGLLNNYLYLNGVESVKGYSINRKNYFMFNIKKTKNEHL